MAEWSYGKLKSTARNNTSKEMRMIGRNKCYLKSLSLRPLGSVRLYTTQHNISSESISSFYPSS